LTSCFLWFDQQATPLDGKDEAEGPRSRNKTTACLIIDVNTARDERAAISPRICTDMGSYPPHGILPGRIVGRNVDQLTEQGNAIDK